MDKQRLTGSCDWGMGDGNRTMCWSRTSGGHHLRICCIFSFHYFIFLCYHALGFVLPIFGTGIARLERVLSSRREKNNMEINTQGVDLCKGEVKSKSGFLTAELAGQEEII